VRTSISERDAPRQFDSCALGLASNFGIENDGADGASNLGIDGASNLGACAQSNQ
tara:strand:+ start:371 stop:535 length:165 start_codon:yes stop_codon:yes gene_type:complete